MDFSGKRITVMGLGTRGGGTGMARYLSSQGAVVTVTDGKQARELQDQIDSLADLPVRYVLGGHQERDFTAEGADLVIRNPAVRSWSPWLAIARSSGVPVEMEMSLFLKLCPAPVIGITGTKGKSTTSALTGEILRHWRSETVVAGNMGVSAVMRLPEITRETPVVLEISNWQLEGLDEHAIGPQIAVLTNISEDHLDTYDSFGAYAQTKQSIATHLLPSDTFVANADDPLVWEAANRTQARIVPFSTATSGHCVTARSGLVRWALPEGEGEAAIPDRPFFRGELLQRNVAAAVAAALVRGAPAEAIQAGLNSFAGIRDRSELVAIIDGIEFINDTSATAPAAVIAALAALRGRRVHILAGGADKRTDLQPLADAIGAGAETASLLEGTATAHLRSLLEARGKTPLGVFTSMDDAVRAAEAGASAGDVVLLSPGCASFGLFRDEFDRGEQFRRVVARLAEEGMSGE